jgi:hypothetical protein
MERNILLDNFASLIVRQDTRFPLVGERPKPPKMPHSAFSIAVQRPAGSAPSGAKEMPQAVSQEYRLRQSFSNPK